MRVVFCGVRGSTSAPGADFVRYGGHTSCVALAHDGERPTLVLDGGTGLRNLTGHLDGHPFQGTILLGHLHWDHTHGLPFFAAGVRPDSTVTVVMPAQDDAEDVFDRAFSPPHFPVTVSDLGGQWRVMGCDEGEHDFEGFRVTTAEIPHKGGRTFGFRVSDGPRSDGGATIAYLSDHSPIAEGDGPAGLGAYHRTAMALARDADVLIHDAQHTAAEFPAVSFLGHSAIEYAVGLAAAAGVRTLVLFHHDPARTDDELDAIGAALQDGPVEVVVASQDLVLDL